MIENYFYLKSDFINHHALLVKIVNSHIWHHRFMHFNDNALKLLGSLDMVQNFTKFESFDDLCESPQKGRSIDYLF